MCTIEGTDDGTDVIRKWVIDDFFGPAMGHRLDKTDKWFVCFADRTSHRIVHYIFRCSEFVGM